MRCSRRMDKQQSVVSLLDLLCTDASYFGGKVNESREMMTTTRERREITYCRKYYEYASDLPV